MTNEPTTSAAPSTICPRDERDAMGTDAAAEALRLEECRYYACDDDEGVAFRFMPGKF